MTPPRRPPPKASWPEVAGKLLLAACAGMGVPDGQPAALPPAQVAEVRDVEDENFRIWTAEDGLASNSVRAMVHTRDGYMWFGTHFGLSRFDGRRFVTFNPETDPPLPGGSVTGLAEDQNGRLVVAVKELGIFVFDGTRFVSAPGNDLLQEELTAGVRISHLRADAEGALWFTLESRVLCRLLPDGGLDKWPVASLAWAVPLRGDAPPMAGWPLPLEDRRIAVPGNHGLSLLDPASGVSEAWGPDSLLDCVATSTQSGGLRVLSGNRVVDVNQAWEITSVREVPGFYNSGRPLQDGAGRLWLIGDEGLYSLNSRGMTRHSVAGRRLPSTLRGPALDREGNVWVFSVQHGVGRLRLPPIESLRSGEDLPSGLPQSVAASADGRLHLAGVGFVGYVNNGAWTTYDLDEYLRRQSDGFTGDSRDDLVRHECLSLSVGDSEEVWYGLAALRHLREKLRTGHVRGPIPLLARRRGDEIRFISCPGFPEGVFSGYSLACTAGQGVWYATDLGLFHYADGTLANWSIAHDLPEVPIYRVFRDRSDRVWFGGEETGLYRVAGEEIKHYTVENGLASDTVLSLHQDESGALWVGSRAGLSRVTGDRVDSLSAGSPFLKLPLREILQDAQGGFWFGTPNGLFHLPAAELEAALGGEPTRLSAIRFGRSDGMANEEVFIDYGRTGCRLPSGELVFCVEGGLVRFDPAQALLTVRGPAVRIVRCGIPGETYLDQSLRRRPPNSPALVLPARASHALTIDYAAITFSEPEQTSFEHRLLGLDPAWTSAGDQRQALYSRLPPGDYRFEVRAYNQNQAVSPEVAVLDFRLQPFWHQRWSVRTASVAVVALLAVVLHRARLRAFRRIEQLERQVALDAERSRIARDMHDEIGSSLGQIRLLGELAHKFEQRHPESEGLARQIANLAHTSSQSLRQIIWSLNPNRSSYDDLLDYLPAVAEDLLSGSGVELLVGAPRLASPAHFSPAFKRELILMMKGILGNVVQHAAATECRLEITLDEGELRVITTDNGRGFDPADIPDASFGLQSLKDRVEARKGHLHIDSAPGKGTRIEVRLPLP